MHPHLLTFLLIVLCFIALEDHLPGIIGLLKYPTSRYINYDASGKLLRKRHYDNSAPAITTDYIDRASTPYCMQEGYQSSVYK
ncbi:MAG: hypothetical protein WC615_04805 [Mucilaginibacter sp.]|jgi:hypothetical protein|uniref:hypothetical protein n=1 Tax=Mucilaginibacter sp. TaxID=1882438 RepID=UPI00356634DC